MQVSKQGLLPPPPRGRGPGWGAAHRPAASAALIAALLAPAHQAAARHPPPTNRTVTIGLCFATSGFDAAENQRMRSAAALALDQANTAHTVPGIAFAPLDLDEAAAGQSDPTRAAANARAFVADPTVIAVVGPSTSLAARAMLPIFNAAGLPTISPSATAADLTTPRYRPSGRLTFLRTAANDQAQGTAIAAYWAATAHPRTVAIFDDGRPYGSALATAFAAAAARHAIRLVAHIRLDTTSDAAAIATLKTAAPAAILYAGNADAGLPFLKEAATALPTALKAAGDGLYGPELLTSVGFPAAEGLLLAVGQPHLAALPTAQPFAQAYRARYAAPADDAALAAYDAATVIILTVKSLATAAKPLTRDTLRAALATAQFPTAQGPFGFDRNGDPTPAPITLYQAHKSPAAPPDSMDAQLRVLSRPE